MAGTSVARAQNTTMEVPPIIDVYHHAMDNDSGFSIGPMCPNTSKFTVSDPKTEAGQQSVWVQLYPTKGEYMKDVLAERASECDRRGLRRSEERTEMEVSPEPGDQNVDYLTPEQERDIVYNNTVRFLRLDTSKK
jgi:hypothetical protein